jgi:hypothetical protein
VGGFDESLRYEVDRDLFLRLTDRAENIAYSPYFVSQHNIPDPLLKSNVTTRITEIERRLFQLRLLNKAILFAAHPEIRAYGRRHKGYTLKRIAEVLVADKNYTAGLYYARAAMGVAPTLKWTMYTAYVALACLASGLVTEEKSTA